MESIKATIITIGDELLIGQVIDTNSAFIAQSLNAIGVAVKSRIAVGDDANAIKVALDEAAEKSQIIIKCRRGLQKVTKRSAQGSPCCE